MGKNVASASGAIVVSSITNGWVINGGNGVDDIDATTLFNGKTGTIFQIIGGNGADTIRGSSRSELIWSDSKDNTDTSSNGSDTVFGGAGNDEIHVGNGADIIQGDADGDTLFGDRGGDIFAYKLTSDSSATASGLWAGALNAANSSGDWIKDFTKSEGDRIDLSGVNGTLTGSGAPMLQWSSGAAAHSVWIGAYGNGTNDKIVYADTNGDSIADIAIRVTGAVDSTSFTGVNHGPTAQGETNSVNEDAAITGTVAGNDSDIDGDTLTYSILGTAPVGLTLNANGTYTFDADSYDSLAQGETKVVTASIKVSDGHGGSATEALSITITGINDAPVAANASGAGHEDDISIHGSVAGSATDADDDAALTFAATASAPAGFSMNADGSWSFDASGSVYQHLAQGATQDVTVGYTVTDNHGAASSASLTITITGTNDLPVATAVTGAGNEDDSSIHGSVAASASDVDDGAVLTFGTTGTVPAGFAMGSNGSWTLDAGNAAYQHLADGAKQDVVVHYTVTDDHGATTGADLTITLTGANDAPVATAVTGAGNEDDSSIHGSVAAGASDVDDGAILAFGATGTLPDGFTMGADGSWSLDASNAAYQHLAAGVTQDLVVHYTVTDDHGATSGADLTLTLTGTNDAPELTGIAATLAAGTEDTAFTVSAADLLAGWSDKDDGSVLSVAGLQADHGTVTDNGDGTFTIAPEANYNGTVGLTYNVTDGTTPVTATQSFSLAAVNDAAVIGGVSTGSVTEDAILNTTSGSLTISDIDSAASFVAATNVASSHGYGTFSIDAAGHWTYALDNGNSSVDALNSGDTLPDSFSVQSADGTTQIVSILINGNTDIHYLAPTIFTGGGDPNDFDGSGLPTDDHIEDTNDGHTVYGGAGDDFIRGNNGDDTIFGGSGSDDVNGNNDGDRIYGGSGNDTVSGSNGNDLIVGGYGADKLTGGNGNDIFRYLSQKDTGDLITDFSHNTPNDNDKIDLHALGVTSFGGNLGTDPNSPLSLAAHSVAYGYDAAHNLTTVYVDTDGAVGADMEIHLLGNVVLTGADFTF
jgi:VCBS repeat-containing protein